MRLARFALPLLLLVQAPAVASPTDVAFAGLDCGVAMVETAPGMQSGILSGGPDVVTKGGQAADAVLRCWLQIAEDYGAGPVMAEAYASGHGVVALVAEVNAMIPEGARVFVCSELYVPGEPAPYHVDSDPSASGDQCPQAESTSTPAGYVYTRPPTTWQVKCADVGPERVCVPLPDQV